MQNRGLTGLLAAGLGLGGAMLAHQFVPAIGVLTWAVALGMLAGNTRLLPAGARQALGKITKRLLRVGIVLLGFSVSFGAIAALGVGTIGLVAATLRQTVTGPRRAARLRPGSPILPRSSRGRRHATRRPGDPGRLAHAAPGAAGPQDRREPGTHTDAQGPDRSRLVIEFADLRTAVRSEKIGEVAAEFDGVHDIHRAVRVGSVDEVVSVARLRPRVIEAIRHGLEGRG